MSQVDGRIVRLLVMDGYYQWWGYEKYAWEFIHLQCEFTLRRSLVGSVKKGKALSKQDFPLVYVSHREGRVPPSS